MKPVLIGPLLSLLVVSASAIASPITYQLPEETADFKPGPGFESAQTYCRTCHSADYIATQPLKKGKAFWEAEEVGVRVRPFRNGGFWAMLVCPRCGGGAQRLRLLDDRPACGKCVRASGLIYRSQSIRTEKRHAVTAPPRLAMLNSDRPLRAHPRLGRTIDGRVNIEFALRRSRIVARKHCVDRAKDQGL